MKNEMPIDEIISVLENEAACVERANTCDRRCAVCDLVMPDDKVLGAYAATIKLLSESHMQFGASQKSDEIEGQTSIEELYDKNGNLKQ